MEIGIQCHNDTIFERGSPDNFRIFRLGQTNFSRVNRVKTGAAKNRCRRTRRSLVEQQFHPAVASSITLSSRLAAA